MYRHTFIIEEFYDKMHFLKGEIGIEADTQR